MSKTTRRGFLEGALAAAAAAWGPAGSSCRGRDAVAPGAAAGFELGLASYTFREFGLDEALAMARRVGLGRIALKDIHLPLDSPDDAIRKAADKVREGGLALYGCGVVYMATEAEVDRAFAYARTAGIGTLIGVPDHALLGRAENRVRETGIRLAIHNHGPGDPRYPTPGSVLERIAGLDPRIGVCLDVGHCTRSGLDPSEEAGRCGARLLDIHMKDVSAAAAEGGTVEVGRGVIDVPDFLRTIIRLGYRGTVAFEHEKDGRDPLAGLAESVGFVRGALAALKARGV
jgi:sugar phosphate isomerase/epimerase